jgi:hypothetical protein
MASCCNICLGEEPEHSLLDLPCIHRVCTECHGRESGSGACPVDKFCQGEPILYEKEPLSVGIARWERNLESLRGRDEKPFMGQDMEGTKAALSRDILVELQKGFVPAETRFFAGRALGKPCYFELVDDTLIEYYHAGSKMWQIPIQFPWDNPSKEFIVTRSGLLIKHFHYSATLTRAGAVYIGNTHDTEVVIDWDTQLTIVKGVICLDGLLAGSETEVIRGKELYNSLPPLLAEIERLSDIKDKKIKAIEANIEVLRLYESFAAAGHSSLLPELARKPPEFAVEKSGSRKPTNVGTITSVRPFTEKHFLVKFGTTYVLPHAKNPLPFDLGDRASWTVNGECLSLWLPEEDRWVGINFVTGEPMEPDPVQRLANFTKCVPRKGEFLVCHNNRIFLNDEEWI